METAYLRVPAGTLYFFRLDDGARISLSEARTTSMDRIAVFVDAGYLFAQGSKELCGTKLARGSIGLDHEVLITTLKTFAQCLCGLPLLRIYWYDGTSQGPSPQHITLADQADIKVRLGFVSSRGEQKGVDSLIVTDMLTLARNRAMAECVLLSGDEDLRVGVQQAQEFGVRVHLLGIRPARGSQSLFLLQESDSTHEWTAKDLGAFLDCRPVSAVSSAQSEGKLEALASDGDFRESLRLIARRIADEVASTEIGALVEKIRLTNQRPQQIDGRLLAMSRTALGHNLNASQKAEVRAAFLEFLGERMADIEGQSDDLS